jgi:NAD(P)-dependent dehydrogenase (short-subunit alcohol dehydrogenase family)/surfactin synthase thioesterase subunit
VAALVAAGVRTVVEIGADGGLSGLMGQTVAATPGTRVVPLVHRRGSEMSAVVAALAQAWVQGAPVVWPAVTATGRRMSLPTYPFQRSHYWLTGTAREHDTQWYRVGWAPVRVDDAAFPPGWLIVVPAGCADDPLIQACTRSGVAAAVLVVAPEDGRDVLRQRLTALRESGDRPSGVLSLLALDERAAQSTLTSGTAATLALIQALGDAELGAPLWCVTRRAVSVADDDPVTSVRQAQVWGLGRTAALEHPGRWGGLVDLPERGEDTTIDRLAGVLTAAAPEDQLAIRPSGVYGRRLRPADDRRGGAAAWRPRGTVLITGGTGGLAAHTARWLARAGAGHLMLLSRTGAGAAGAAALRAELTGLGARVTLVACDVADRSSLAAALADVPADQPVTAVFHTAGVSHVADLDGTTPADLAAAAAGKVAGAVHLDELLGDRPLDAFVMFSSIAGTWGAGGQAAYSAANAFLDALARHRRDRGLKATAVAWGPWAGGGMADAVAVDRLRRRGLRPMPAGAAIAALREALDRDETAVTVADVDWSRFLPLFTSGRPSALFADLIPGTDSTDREPGERPHDDDPAAARVAALRSALRGRPADEQAGLLGDLVSTQLAAVLGYADGAELDRDADFLELGLDSLTALDLGNRLNAETGLHLPANVAFVNTSLDTLVEHIRIELDKVVGAVTEARSGSVAARPGRDADAVIVGGLVALFVTALEQDRIGEVIGILADLAGLRPMAQGSALAAALPPPVRLARGVRRPRVIMFPSHAGMSTAQQYVRLAAHFRDLRDVTVLSLPGFRGGGALPAGYDELLDVLADAVQDVAAGAPVVLAGHSAGGLIANAVAGRLAERGAGVDGVVLLDTYAPWQNDLFIDPMKYHRSLYDNVIDPDDESWLTAWAWYSSFPWSAVAGAAPTLLITAREPLDQWRDVPEWRCVWAGEHEISETTGDHFSMMTDLSERTAALMEHWFQRLEQA